MSDTQITVIGCGLIGGSICLALKRRKPSWRIVCLDIPEKLPAIREAGVADEVAALEDVGDWIPKSRLVILAVPVGVICQTLDRIVPHLKSGTIVTDVGSTKVQIMRHAKDVLPEGVHFIGGHPIAGAEHSGVTAADPLLFNGRVYMLCPFADTPADALLFLIDMVEELLGVPTTIEPEEHDRILAMISHVPQLLSIALVHAALADDATHGLLDMVAGRGFLDLTRIAASDFPMWEGILETNKGSIHHALDQLESSLSLLRESLDKGNLEAVWERVSKRRRTMSLESMPRMRKLELRGMIDRYDEQILKAIGNRQRIVHRIGKLKADRQTAVLDPDRERRMMVERHNWGKSLDVDEEFVDELFAVITSHSRNLQAKKKAGEDD